MRVLWVCNIVLPAIARQLNIEYSCREGWLSGAAEKMLSPEEDDGIELGISFPCSLTENELTVTLDNGAQVRCFAFDEDLKNPQRYDPSLEIRFREIIDEFKPDIIHIFGTEFPHTLACARAWGKPDGMLIGIQGLCCVIGEKYLTGIPARAARFATFRDIVRHDSLKDQQRKFIKRGDNEKEALRLTGSITGRTVWDKEETAKINPDARYYPMNETMRQSFYKASWNRDNCAIHSIFLSQGDYPIKGMHFMLEAMPRILASFPDAMLYVAGNDIIHHGSFSENMKMSGYGRYLLGLIRKEHIGDHVVMLGMLDEEQISQQMLSSNVFVCPSVIENSPNSLSEAMLLGTPCVAANVGGIPDLMVGGQDGILYDPEDVDALADAVAEIFAKKEVSKLYSISAKKHAYVTHDPEVNFRRMLEIYKEIAEDTDKAEKTDRVDTADKATDRATDRAGTEDTEDKADNADRADNKDNNIE